MLLRSFHTGNIGNIRSFQVDTACSVSLLHMLVCRGCDITALHVSFPRINHDEICHFQEEEAELIVLLVTSIIVFIYISSVNITSHQINKTLTKRKKLNYNVIINTALLEHLRLL